MSAKQTARQVLRELKAHAPFTMFGAVLGVGFMLLFRNLSAQAEYKLFYIFHPAHVVLSAIVTASLFRLHERTRSFVIVLLVGYFGSIGIATLSDSIIPFFGESVLGIAIPEAHIGFIEKWYIVNPAAFLGVFIAYFLPRTKLPHAGHVLISTWASSMHVMMNLHDKITTLTMIGFFMVLFVAVWVPCCVSDIIFPMLFVKSHTGSEGPCPACGEHGYSHTVSEESEEPR